MIFITGLKSQQKIEDLEVLVDLIAEAVSIEGVVQSPSHLCTKNVNIICSWIGESATFLNFCKLDSSTVGKPL